MSCSQTLSGIVGDCGTNSGGALKTIYIANFSDVTETISNGVVSSITAGVFFAYDLKKNSVSLSSNWTIDEGIRFAQNDVTASLAKMTTEKRIELESLIAGDLYIIVGDANGKYWAIGSTEGAQISALTGTTGTARTDANQYDFTFTSYDTHFPYEVDGSLIDTLVAATA